MSKIWLLLVEPEPLAGSLNMAVDEHLFHALGGGPATVLRFYRWVRPTASLGRGQKAEQVVNREFCSRNGIDIVRRLTGGKLVLHHREITYSVASNDIGVFTDTLAGSYRLISRALVLGLKKMGLDADLAGQAPPSYARGTMPCFTLPARDEVEIGGLKIIGSAQKRAGGAFLQHGSIPVSHDPALLRAVSLYPEEGDLRMTSLSEVLGREVGYDWAVERMTAGFAEFFGAELRPLTLADADRDAVRALEGRKYASAAWTFEGREDGPAV